MTLYKQVNSPAAAVVVEDVKVFMDRSVSAGRCRCPRPSGERLTLGQQDGSFLSGRLEVKVTRNKMSHHEFTETLSLFAL